MPTGYRGVKPFTAGARAGAPTPQAYMADNDVALGRIVEAVSKSPFWKNTLIAVLEFEDVADEDTFDRILWRTIKGANVPQ